MTDITQCPECGTRFKVTAAQLEAHGGEVRCGRCHGVFDASQHFYEVEPNPQLSLPIDLEPELGELASVHPDYAAPPTDEDLIAEQPETPVSADNPEPEISALETPPPDDSGDETSHDASNQIEPDEAAHPEISTDEIEHYLPPISDIAELEEAPATLAQQVKFIDEPAAPYTPPARKRRWPGILSALLLLLILLAQAVYFLRVEIATTLPGLKPVLAQYCALLNCTIELPRQAELMSIESSELEADPTQVGIITLHALLHNRATFTQAYPSLELTLNDLQDQAVARRVFHPVHYLNNAAEAPSGLAANRELEITLRLDIADLRPAGYRLFLFYPK